MNGRDNQLSKFLSWLLRHGAVREKLQVSQDGYIQISAVLNHKSIKGRFCATDIERVVNNNDKQRFKLRLNPHSNVLERKANQGHTISEVNNTDLKPILEPIYKTVVHGTYLKCWPQIKLQGLSRMKRQHIHLAKGPPGAAGLISGVRQSCQLYIYIHLEKALADGINFYESENGVLLTPGNDEGYLQSKYFLNVVNVITGEQLHHYAMEESALQPVEGSSYQSVRLTHKNSPKKPTSHKEQRPDIPSPKRSPRNRPNKSRNGVSLTQKSLNGLSSDTAPENKPSSQTQEPIPSSSKEATPNIESSDDSLNRPVQNKHEQNEQPSPKRTPKIGSQPYTAKGRRQESEGNGEPSQRPAWITRRSYDNDENIFNKVILTDFPAYAQRSDIIRAVSPYGAGKVEVCRNRTALVVFQSALEAEATLRADKQILIYGHLVSAQRYTNRRHMLNLIKANRRIVNNVHKGPDITAPSEIDLSGDFYQQLMNIENAIRLTREEVANIGQLFADIETVLKPIWPTCRAIPFGSITTGLGIKSSDADCFMEMRPGSGAGVNSSNFVRTAAAALRRHPDLFSQLVPIPKANTPIIKFLHVPTNVHCDLNSKTPLGTQNSQLLRHLLASDPRLSSLALLLKYWARVHGLSGTGRISNYALMMLLIFYLQRSILPPIARLQTSAHTFMVENWNAGFDPSPLPAPPTPPPGPASVRDLLGGFFLYYTSFNFEELVASPLVGEPLKKALFETEEDKLPAELSLYMLNVRQRLARPLRTRSCVCVQDPFELCHNVASAVTPRLFADLKAHFTLGGAAYTRGDSPPGAFLRAALTERPPSPTQALDARTALRVDVPRRVLAALPDEWRDIAREVVTHSVFEDMLDIQLTRRDAVSREPDVEIEVYVGNVTRPVWKRGKHSNGRCPTVEVMVARHAAITRRLQPHAPHISVPLEVELGFREEPRGLSITTSAMDGMDVDAFREFRRFVHTYIHRWTRELLKAHACSPPEPEAPPPRVEGPPSTVSKPKDVAESMADISLVDRKDSCEP